MKGPFFIFLFLMPGFIVLILMILLAMQYKQLKSLVAPEPMPMAEVHSTPESRARVAARIDSFVNVPPRAAADGNADTLILDAADLNDLARSSEVLRKQHLDYHISLEDTLFTARNSMPIEHLRGVLASLARALRVHGYLNSEMKGYPRIEDGKLYIVPVAAIMNGTAAPASVLSSKGKLEIREWFSDPEAFDKGLKALSEVKIRDGRLLLIRK